MFLFDKSFINEDNELILVPKTNLYFSLKDVKTYQDLVYKIIAWCSRDMCKSEHYNSNSYNKKYRKDLREKINTFLGVDYTEKEWFNIYDKYGNGINEAECRNFIRENF